MAFCIQCGESLTLDAAICPGCRRPVGASSIGAARDLVPSPGRKKAVVGALAALALVLVATAAWSFWKRSRGLTVAEQDSIASAALESLVEIDGPSGKVAGVVVKSLDGALVVATRPLATDGLLRVSTARGWARGFLWLSGEERLSEAFALVLVPDGRPLGVREARLADAPVLDAPLAMLDANGEVVAGRVLSFDAGPGVIVHDADVDRAMAARGLWSADGRLLALPTANEAAGAHLAVAVNALFARLLLHKLPLQGAEWTEEPLNVAVGTRVAVALESPEAERLSVRIGRGSGTRSRLVAPGVSTISFTAQASGPLQLGGGLTGTALAATFGRIGE
jgi:hypothetical protein